MPNPPTFPYAFTCPTHGAVHSRTPEPCCGNALPVHAVCDGTEPRLTGMDVLAAAMAENEAWGGFPPDPPAADMPARCPYRGCLGEAGHDGWHWCYRPDLDDEDQSTAATPPGRSADEIRAAIFDIIRQAVPADRAHALADWITDRVVGPLIAERDELGQHAADMSDGYGAASKSADFFRGRLVMLLDLDERPPDDELVGLVGDRIRFERQRVDQAEAERADAERRARRLSADLDEVSAERDEQRQRAERAESRLKSAQEAGNANYDALQAEREHAERLERGNVEFDRTIADRDTTIAVLRATITDLEGQGARLATAKDTFADELAKAQEASIADAETIGRVRALPDHWRNTVPGDLHDAAADLESALDGTDGGA